MNKKLIIGISAAVVVIIGVIIGILCVTGTIDIAKPNKSESSANVASSVDADGNTVFTIKDKDIKKNSIVSVPVIVENNPGFYAGEFLVTYENTALSYVGYDNGEIFGSFEVAPQNDNAVKFLAFNNDFKDVKKDGVIIYLNFKAVKANKDGEYKITIQKEGTKLGNTDVKEVNADILIGDATVK